MGLSGFKQQQRNFFNHKEKMMSSTFNASILTEQELVQVSGGYMDWEVDWCGTRVPGWPRPKSTFALVDAVSLVALNPQPLPPQGDSFGMMF
jgi:hypothetical protein